MSNNLNLLPDTVLVENRTWFGSIVLLWDQVVPCVQKLSLSLDVNSTTPFWKATFEQREPIVNEVKQFTYSVKKLQMSSAMEKQGECFLIHLRGEPHLEVPYGILIPTED